MGLGSVRTQAQALTALAGQPAASHSLHGMDPGDAACTLDAPWVRMGAQPAAAARAQATPQQRLDWLPGRPAQQLPDTSLALAPSPDPAYRYTNLLPASPSDTTGLPSNWLPCASPVPPPGWLGLHSLGP